MSQYELEANMMGALVECTIRFGCSRKGWPMCHHHFFD